MTGFSPIWDMIRDMPHEERIRTEKKIMKSMFGIDLDDMFIKPTTTIPDTEIPFECRRSPTLYSVRELTDLLKKGVYEI